MPFQFNPLSNNLEIIHKKIVDQNSTIKAFQGTALDLTTNTPLAQWLVNNAIVFEYQLFGGESEFHFNTQSFNIFGTTDWNFGAGYRSAFIGINLNNGMGPQVPCAFLIANQDTTRTAQIIISANTSSPIMDVQFNIVSQLTVSSTGKTQITDEKSTLQRVMSEYSSPGNQFLLMGA